MTCPRTVVIVLNWNGLADTIQCLDSLGRVTYRGDLEVVVIDNGSEDGSPAALRARFPRITVLENHRNLGYTGGNNVGLRYALALGAQYIWLLNNDTTVDPDSLSELVRAAEAGKRIALLSPQVWEPARDDVYWAGTVLDLGRRRFVDLAAARKRGAAVPDGPLLLAGTGMLIKRVAVETVGFLEDRYFAYVEDFDYSLRVIKAGFETAVVQEARIVHARSQSLGQLSPLRHYLISRNRFLFWRSHLGKEWTLREMARHAARTLGEADDLERDGRREMAAACRDAVWDAVRGHFGDMARKGQMPRLLRRVLAWHPYLSIWLLEGRYGEVAQQIGARLLKRIGR